MSQSTIPANEPIKSGSMQDRRVVALAGVAGVLVLGVVAYFLLFSGGGGSGSTFKPIAKGAPASSAAASPPASAQPSDLVLPAAYAGPAGRNPFSPLVTPTPSPTPKASTGAGTSTAPSATPTPTPVIVIPTLTPTPNPTVTVTSTPSPTGLPTSSTAETLTLVSVNYAAATATVSVTDSSGTNNYSPHTGTVFAKFFKLDSVLTDAATPPNYAADFQYGDQFVQLTVGESAQLGG